MDFFLLLMLAGAGDELQGIKRGIMEMADGLVITKADGENEKYARAARVEYQTAMHLFPPSPYKWTPKALVCSAVTKMGVPEIWDMIMEYKKTLTEGKHWQAKRHAQIRDWMRDAIFQRLEEDFFNHKDVSKSYSPIENEVLASKRSPFQAAEELLKLFHNK